jgi:hypothetical protein
MKKIYSKPSMLVVDVKVEAIMHCCSTNFKENVNGTGVSVNATNMPTAIGGTADAAGYRSNLWGD